MDIFTPDEIKYLSNMGGIIAGKAIKDYLFAIVTESDMPANVKTDLLQNINALDVPDYSGNITLDIPNAPDQRIRLQLSLVPADHTINISVPAVGMTQVFLRQFFAQMDQLINSAMVYYKHIVEKNDNLLLKKLQAAFTTTDCSKFKINNKTRNICFDESSNWRVGILCDIITFTTNEQDPMP